MNEDGNSNWSISSRLAIYFGTEDVLAIVFPLVRGVNRAGLDGFGAVRTEPSVAILNDLGFDVARSWFAVPRRKVALNHCGGFRGDGTTHERVGRSEIAFHQHWRNRQNIANVVEAMSDVIGGEVGCRIEVDAD